jgi:hypothetical protein
MLHTSFACGQIQREETLFHLHVRGLTSIETDPKAGETDPSLCTAFHLHADQSERTRNGAVCVWIDLKGAETNPSVCAALHVRETDRKKGGTDPFACRPIRKEQKRIHLRARRFICMPIDPREAGNDPFACRSIQEKQERIPLHADRSRSSRNVSRCMPTDPRDAGTDPFACRPILETQERIRLHAPSAYQVMDFEWTSGCLPGPAETREDQQDRAVTGTGKWTSEKSI